MKTNHVREKLKRGEPTIGCFLGLGSPNVAELMAHAGFEWLVIETEHNGLDSAEIQHMLMALSGAETIPLVRVPSSNPVFIQRALDLGALGIVVPMVRSADEARAIVSATRYPPAGSRGFGPLRASRYTLDNDDYIRRANDNILVTLILETREATESLEQIMSVPGVDALFLGLWDLCFSLGLNPLEMPHRAIDEVIDRTLATGRRMGMAVGIGESTPEGLRNRKAQGFTLLSYGTDYSLLVGAALAGLEAYRR